MNGLSDGSGDGGKADISRGQSFERTRIVEGAVVGLSAGR